MLNEAVCPDCSKGSWGMQIDYVVKEILFTCQNCGHKEQLSVLFGKKKKVKKVVKNEMDNSEIREVES